MPSRILKSNFLVNSPGYHEPTEIRSVPGSDVRSTERLRFLGLVRAQVGLGLGQPDRRGAGEIDVFSSGFQKLN